VSSLPKFPFLHLQYLAWHLALPRAQLLWLLINVSDKREQYELTLDAINSLCAGETDEIALMATISCELFHRMPGFDWVGFYRVTSPELMKIGPYQGGHGCITIPFDHGVCGRAAKTKETQIVRDVNKLPYHIACSSSTQSEIVVPIFDKLGRVRAVLDVDSDKLANFDSIDQTFLETVVKIITPTFN
jgi:GAF domain-containing protein